jgi:hypothetical protein
MRRSFWLPVLVCAALHACDAWSRSSGSSNLPAGITQLIPKGYEELDHLAGQLTDADRLDYLVVVHRTVDTAQQPSPRPLLIFTQNSDGSFRLAARNDSVVLRAGDGGQCDPFEDGENGLAIKNRYFTVQNSVACGDHWTDYVTFHYDKDRRDWIFRKEIAQTWHPDDDPDGDALKADPARVTTADNGHPVSFGAWRPEGWCTHPWVENHEQDRACR